MLIFSIRLLVKIVVLATCTKACFLSQKVYYIFDADICFYGAECGFFALIKKVSKKSSAWIQC
ncbi:hypothetical protein [Cardinium endosymbiont of Tipula unca]|uniref:hypothetical protein n=1 Tax=Cardinium endosymbiont of Tipula unca TaxID=3066216 RepID=UPI0030CCA44E